MQIQYHVGRIKSHISIVQAQEREAIALVEFITSWYRQISSDGMTDTAFIEALLQNAETQLQNIRRRHALLESMTEQFTRLNRYTQELLEDTKDSVRVFDAIL